jgi:uncharacterized protein (UPF0548 family)
VDAPLQMTSIRLSSDPPPCKVLKTYASTHAVNSRSFNHDFMPGGKVPEQNLRVISLRTRLGCGNACYRRAQRALHAWRMHEGSTRTGIYYDGNAVVTWARMCPGVWVLNPCRPLPAAGLTAAVQGGLSTRRADARGYATTRGHLLAGCEIMTVRQSSTDSSVHFEVHSASRGCGPIGRLLFPFLAPAQHRYFRDQVRCMRLLCSDGTSIPGAQSPKR